MVISIFVGLPKKVESLKWESLGEKGYLLGI